MIFVLITRNCINAHRICKEGTDAVTPAIFVQKKSTTVSRSDEVCSGWNWTGTKATPDTLSPEVTCRKDFQL